MSDYVVKLVSDFELLVNMGEDQVEVGDVLEVLDPLMLDVTDPKTGNPLGSIDRAKARIVVNAVTPLMALCGVINRRTSVSAVARVMSGEQTKRISGSAPSWPEGVQPEDPVRKTGRRRDPK